MSDQLPRVLLVEPQFVLRRTIVMVARDLGMVEFDEASSVGRARTLLSAHAYDGVVLSLEEMSAAMDLLHDLRLSRFVCASDIRVVALATDIQPEYRSRLEVFGVAHVLRKPVRISDLLNTMDLVG